LAAVLLAGGSSRIPLVSEIVSEAFGRPVRVSLHPKHTVALGAAAIAMNRLPEPAPATEPAATVPDPREDKAPAWTGRVRPGLVAAAVATAVVVATGVAIVVSRGFGGASTVTPTQRATFHLTDRLSASYPFTENGGDTTVDVVGGHNLRLAGGAGWGGG